MAKSIDDLDRSLQDILKALQAANKASGAGSGSGTGTGGARGPQTLRDVFQNSFRQSMQRGGPLQQMAAHGAGFLGRASGSGAAVGGATGAIAGPIVAVGIELAKVPGRVKEFVEGLHSANKALAQFSPTMAQIMAKSDVADFMRNMRKGEMVAESAGRLAETRGRLNEAMLPAETGMQNLWNSLGNFAGSAVSNFLEKSGWGKQLGEIADSASKQLDLMAEHFGGQSEAIKYMSTQEELEQFMNREAKKIDRKRAGPLANAGAAGAGSSLTQRLRARGANPRLDG